MSENNRDNPFEKHINSDAFDVSNLGEDSRNGEIRAEVIDFLARLPQPLTHELWDSELDDKQKAISAHLTRELVNQVMRTRYAEELESFSADELSYMLMVPVALAMLAEEHLHRKSEPTPEPPNVIRIGHPTSYPSNSVQGIQLPQVNFEALRSAAQVWYQRAKTAIQRLLDRR